MPDTATGTSTVRSGSNGRPAIPGPADDVVDLLLAQHARIEELFLLVGGSTGDTRRDAFDELVRLLTVHETAEEELIHPLVRTLPDPGGGALVDDRLEEERQAREALIVLVEEGVDAPGFDAGIVLLREAVLQHARHEERYEFIELRQHVQPERLRKLAGALRAAEAVVPIRPYQDTGSAKASLATAPTLAIADRVRDAIRRAAD